MNKGNLSNTKQRGEKLRKFKNDKADNFYKFSNSSFNPETKTLTYIVEGKTKSVVLPPEAMKNYQRYFMNCNNGYALDYFVKHNFNLNEGTYRILKLSTRTSTPMEINEYIKSINQKFDMLEKLCGQEFKEAVKVVRKAIGKYLNKKNVKISIVHDIFFPNVEDITPAANQLLPNGKNVKVYTSQYIDNVRNTVYIDDDWQKTKLIKVKSTVGGGEVYDYLASFVCQSLYNKNKQKQIKQTTNIPQQILAIVANAINKTIIKNVAGCLYFPIQIDGLFTTTLAQAYNASIESINAIVNGEFKDEFYENSNLYQLNHWLWWQEFGPNETANLSEKYKIPEGAYNSIYENRLLLASLLHSGSDERKKYALSYIFCCHYNKITKRNQSPAEIYEDIYAKLTNHQDDLEEWKNGKNNAAFYVMCALAFDRTFNLLNTHEALNVPGDDPLLLNDLESAWNDREFFGKDIPKYNIQQLSTEKQEPIKKSVVVEKQETGENKTQKTEGNEEDNKEPPKEGNEEDNKEPPKEETEEDKKQKEVLSSALTGPKFGLSKRKLKKAGLNKRQIKKLYKIMSKSKPKSGVDVNDTLNEIKEMLKSIVGDKATNEAETKPNTPTVPTVQKQNPNTVKNYTVAEQRPTVNPNVIVEQKKKLKPTTRRETQNYQPPTEFNLKYEIEHNPRSKRYVNGYDLAGFSQAKLNKSLKTMEKILKKGAINPQALKTLKKVKINPITANLIKIIGTGANPKKYKGGVFSSLMSLIPGGSAAYNIAKTVYNVARPLVDKAINKYDEHYAAKSKGQCGYLNTEQLKQYLIKNQKPKLNKLSQILK